MAGNRGFSPDDIKEKKTDYHGGCRYVRTSPDMALKGFPSLNIHLTFEEALRLSTAIQAGILALNRYNRRDKGGKEMGLSLSVKQGGSVISVIEVPLRKRRAAVRPNTGSE